MRITTRQSRATSSSRRAHLQTLGPIRLRLLSALSTDSRLPTRQTRRNLRLFPTQNVSLLRSTGLALLYHSLYRREAARSSSSSSVVRLIPLLRTTKPTRPTRVTALRMTRQPLAVERRSRTSEVGFSSSLRRRSRSFFMRADRVGDGAGRSLRSTSPRQPLVFSASSARLAKHSPRPQPPPHSLPRFTRLTSPFSSVFHTTAFSSGCAIRASPNSRFLPHPRRPALAAALRRTPRSPRSPPHTARRLRSYRYSRSSRTTRSLRRSQGSSRARRAFRRV
ncbi:hypothetical protein BJY59DRAFT_462323 [Rhodotorula toruloides]